MWQQGAPAKPCVLVWNGAVPRRAHTTHQGLEISLRWEDFSHHISASIVNLKGDGC